MIELHLQYHIIHIMREQPELEQVDLYASGKGSEKQQSQKQTNSNMQDEQSSADNDSEAELQQQGFKIMTKNADNQVLLIKLKPDNVLWYRGHILFSSVPIPLYKSLLDQFGKVAIDKFIGNSLLTKDLVNLSKQMGYYMLSKQQPYTGKILILSQNIYKQPLYINTNYLLTINYESSQYTLRTHHQHSYLKKIQPIKHTTPLFISLQSRRYTSIIQKYLDIKQTLYLPNATIVGMSQKIQCKWDTKSRMMRYTGPGFVFFQPCSKRIGYFRNKEVVLANAFLIVFILLLYLVQYLFLI